MKILILTNYYPPYYIGGYELACFQTVKYLENIGHEVFVLTGEHKKQSSKFEKVYRKLKYINYTNSSYKNKHSVECFNYETTKEFIEITKPDLVYVWSLRLVSLSPLWAVEKLNKKKVFEIGDFWMKGFLSNHLFSKIKRKVKEFLPVFKARKIEIDPIISVSKWMIKDMKELYGSKKIFHVPNGTTISNKKYEKSRHRMNYIFCGRLDYSKGLDIALKALGNLKDKRLDDFNLDIYGDGDQNYIKKCKKIVQLLNLEDNVIFHGKKDDLSKAYEKAHVLLMPTRMKEPFGLVIIEAMNYGVIPIATNNYGPSEIIDDDINGLLFKPSSINDLIYKILLIHNNWDLLEKYGDNAKKKVKEKFNMNIVKKQVENILLDLAGDKNE